jgi:hypothetical protein
LKCRWAWKSTCTPAQHASKQLRDDLPGFRSAIALCVAVLGAVAGAGSCNEFADCSARQRVTKNLNFRTPLPIVSPSADLDIDRRRFNRSKFIFAAPLAGRERTNTQLSIFLSHLKTQTNCG